MSKHQTWLWPDRTIGKRESRELRDEHNALVNSHVALREALAAMVELYAPSALECEPWTLSGNSRTDAVLRLARSSLDQTA